MYVCELTKRRYRGRQPREIRGPDDVVALVGPKLRRERRENFVVLLLNASLSDDELAAIIKNKLVHLYVLYVNGVPAGMAEIDATGRHMAEIRFFGLAPDFIGRGLSRYFLSNVVDLAWSHNPEEVRIETCTLDHPAALALYQKFGFDVFDQRRGRVTLLEPNAGR